MKEWIREITNREFDNLPLNLFSCSVLSNKLMLELFVYMERDK